MSAPRLCCAARLYRARSAGLYFDFGSPVRTRTGESTEAVAAAPNADRNHWTDRALGSSTPTPDQCRLCPLETFIFNDSRDSLPLGRHSARTRTIYLAQFNSTAIFISIIGYSRPGLRSDGTGLLPRTPLDTRLCTRIAPQILFRK